MKTLKILFLTLSLLGFLDASYLTLKYYQGEAPTCAFFKGCDIVTTSKYATIFGVSIALLGAIYYLALFILSVLYLDTKNPRFIKIGAIIAGGGFLFSLWLIYLQLFVINALCIYCLVSALSSTALFLAGLIIWKLEGNFANSSNAS